MEDKTHKMRKTVLAILRQSKLDKQKYNYFYTDCLDSNMAYSYSSDRSIFPETRFSALIGNKWLKNNLAWYKNRLNQIQFKTR